MAAITQTEKKLNRARRKVRKWEERRRKLESRYYDLRFPQPTGFKPHLWSEDVLTSVEMASIIGKRMAQNLDQAPKAGDTLRIPKHSNSSEPVPVETFDD